VTAPTAASDAGDWRPAASAEVLTARAAMLSRIRGFFSARRVLEVETPILSRAATTDPALHSLHTRRSGPGCPDGQQLFLHTSPELPMKRLLAAGSGPIYQVCKVFRDGERGRLHHPEFSLLEWYRPGWGLDALMDEVGELVGAVLDRTDLADERIGYRDLFRDRLDIDPWRADADELRTVARRLGLAEADRLDLDRDGWLDLLLTRFIEPGLGRGRLTFIQGYPPSQAALAQIITADEGTDAIRVAQRFELYIDGMELANGFEELSDAVEQRARFEADLVERAANGEPAMPIDNDFLAALEAGLPDCSGVALGLDRLLMIGTGAGHIDEVLAFPVERA
jgi:lysyl-tRNA synthetase class 2